MSNEFPSASYDAWKTHNPADDWLGPDPFDCIDSPEPKYECDKCHKPKHMTDENEHPEFDWCTGERRDVLYCDTCWKEKLEGKW